MTEKECRSIEAIVFFQAKYEQPPYKDKEKLRVRIDKVTEFPQDTGYVVYHKYKISSIYH